MCRYNYNCFVIIERNLLADWWVPEYVSHFFFCAYRLFIGTLWKLLYVQIYTFLYIRPQVFSLIKWPSVNGACRYIVILKQPLVFYYTLLMLTCVLTVSSDALRGSTPQASAQVLQWVSFADSEIIPPASAWVFPTLGIMQFNKQVSFEYLLM